MPKLFEKSSIKKMQLKNRLIRSATFEKMSDENGFPTENLFKLYERLAKGGVGLIVTGFSYVAKDGRNTSVGMLGIDSDDHIPRHRELVKHVHKYGSKIAMQIAHCGRQTTEKDTGTQPIAPSKVKDKLSLVTPREMTEGDIERIIEAFAQAVRRVKESGFDAVQYHGAHGYLINQFLCPHTNRRKDKWGGSLENRMRFLQEIHKRSRSLVGSDYPILIKMNAYDNMKKGLILDEAVIMAEMMSEMGIDAIEVSCGISEDGGSALRGNLPLDVIIDDLGTLNDRPVIRFIMRHFGKKIIKMPPLTKAYNLESARLIKSRVSVPVIAVGGITEPQAIKDIIENDYADFVSLCRPLIANPKFPEKIKKGSTEESECIHCNHCIFYATIRPLRCYRGKRIKKDIND